MNEVRKQQGTGMHNDMHDPAHLVSAMLLIGDPATN